MSLLSFSHGLQSCHLPDLWQTQVEQQTGKRDEWMRGKFWFVAADGWAANCLPSCGLCDNIASPLLRCLLDRHSFLCLAFCVLCFSVKESLYQFSPQTLRCLWAAAVKPCVLFTFSFMCFWLTCLFTAHRGIIGNFISVFHTILKKPSFTLLSDFFVVVFFPHLIFSGWRTVAKKNRGSTGKEPICIFIILPAL